MIDQKLINQTESYINEHYISPEWLREQKQQGFKFSINMRLGDSPSEIRRTESIIRILKDKIGLASNYFSDYLFMGDLNNDKLADLMAKWLHEKKLDIN